MLPRKNVAKYSVQKLSGAALKAAPDVAAVEEPLEIRVSLEVDGKRYDDGAIRRLYESSEYRLPRRTVV